MFEDNCGEFTYQRTCILLAKMKAAEKFVTKLLGINHKFGLNTQSIGENVRRDIMLLPNVQEFPVIIKILKEEYIESLLNGNLYMNNLKFFVDLEKETGKQGVGDIREASLLNIKRHELFIQINGEDRQQVEIGSAPGIIYDEKALYHPVFCAIGKIINLENNGKNQYVGILQLQEENIVDFISGEDSTYKAVVIVNCIDFLDKINRNGIPGKHGFVKYRDMGLPNIVDGKWFLDDTFTKDNRFKNQSEFRIELFIHSEKPYVLEIGDIRNFAFVVECKTLLTGLTIIQNIEFDEVD